MIRSPQFRSSSRHVRMRSRQGPTARRRFAKWLSWWLERVLCRVHSCANPVEFVSQLNNTILSTHTPLHAYIHANQCHRQCHPNKTAFENALHRHKKAAPSRGYGILGVPRGVQEG
eukprot:9476556-Pyramimonas_sp.AAC.2